MLRCLLVCLLLLSLVSSRVINIDDVVEMKSKKTQGKHHKHKHLAPYHTEEYILDDGDDVGPYMKCASYEDGISTTVKCPLAAEDTQGPTRNGLSCFSVWQDDLLMSQGCWIHQEADINYQCNPKKCTSRKSDDDEEGAVQFCCCRGHECNRNYYTEEDKAV